jgi:hypothetical protein
MDLSKLLNWYLEQCDGNWEHTYGFLIETLDNPGIRISIDLRGTKLEHEELEPISTEMQTDDRWLYCCKTAESRFEGASHPTQFGLLLEIFYRWEGEGQNRPPKD